MKGKYKCIYNPQLAGFLMMNGIHLLRIEKNLDRPWTNVYLFENKEEIKGLIDKYKTKKSTEVNNNGNNNEGSNLNAQK